MSKEAEVYQTGNAWQKKVYQTMSSYLETIPEIKDFGKSKNGNKYRYLLKEEHGKFNFLNEEIFLRTKERFENHKAGDFKRILTNTAASQAYCFNLVIHLNSNTNLSNALFSDLIGKDVEVVHIEPEFTPNRCNDVKGFESDTDESIGDQNFGLGIGTDADIAVFYKYDTYKKGVLLIEFKFIEAEFSTCSSYKNKNKKDLKKLCSSENYFNVLVDEKDLRCGYNKYFNWELTSKSKVIDINKVKLSQSCPFRFGINQLWRNFILAEQVAKARKCEEYGFWVFSPKENYKYLWKNGETEDDFKSILTEKGNNRFRNISLESILDMLQKHVVNEVDRSWLKKLIEKYRI